ncbi:hypothetical protein V8E36_000035 [Tilletia maclaganii]
MNAAYEHGCQQYAIGNCPNYQAPQNANSYAILRDQCLRSHWEHMTSNDQCPHPAADCLCYNGCVQDRHDSEKDVGGWCMAACKRGVQVATYCT